MFDTFTVSYSHQNYLVDQSFSYPNSNTYPMNSSPCWKPFVTYSFSICKLMCTLFPHSENNYPCCKDLSFTEFSSPFYHDSSIYNTSRLPMDLWTDACPKTGTFMFLPLNAHPLYCLPTNIFIRRVDYACAPL